MSAFLVDTNVLVYAHDPRDRPKQARAVEVLSRIVPSGQAVLSVQCLTEFFRTVRWRLPEPLNPDEALAQVQRFSHLCQVLDLTPPIVLDACRATNAYSLAIWDALIWAAARYHNVPYVLTEDFSHGALLEGVRFLNPFAAGFDLALLEPRR